MKASPSYKSSYKWWLVPLGILAASAVAALGVLIFGSSFVSRSPAEVAGGVAAEQRAAGEGEAAEIPATDCSGALASNYACHQQRYHDLVSGFGVEAAFEELRKEYKTNDFVRASCHQLTHVIGRAALELYGGDVSSAYAHGSQLCSVGYHHGVMEALVAKSAADNNKVFEEPDAICAELREGHHRYSFYHYGCAHGLGHGLMVALGHEPFESLKACDALTDEWEKENCYGGVFMENIMAHIAHDTSSSSHPSSSKYLKAEEPLYPCTEVQSRYKKMCYATQTSYPLHVQGYDFGEVFDLCAATAEEDYRPACYRSLGRDAAGRSIDDKITDAGQAASAKMLRMLGEDYRARSGCIQGAVSSFILYYRSDEQAKALCRSLTEAEELRQGCLKAAEDRYRRGVFYPD